MALMSRKRHGKRDKFGPFFRKKLGAEVSTNSEFRPTIKNHRS